MIPMNASNSIISLPVRSIRLDQGIQQRAKILDNGTVIDYAEAMKAKNVFPPVTVFHDGADYWLADGYHRIEAADEAGLEAIPAEIRKGTRRDAILFACGANKDHGLRRTRADVRRAITTLVMDAEWGSLAHRAIADKVGCSDKTVAAVRDGLSRCGNSAPEDTDQHAHDAEHQLGNFPNCTPHLIIEEMEGDDLAGIRQAAAMLKGEPPPAAPAKASPPLKRTGRDGKSYPTTKAKPAPKPTSAPKPTPKPAPAVNKAKVAMQAAHGVAAALMALQPLETELLPEDAKTVMSNLRTALARLESRFGTEDQGHA